MSHSSPWFCFEDFARTPNYEELALTHFTEFLGSIKERPTVIRWVNKKNCDVNDEGYNPFGNRGRFVADAIPDADDQDTMDAFREMITQFSQYTPHFT